MVVRQVFFIHLLATPAWLGMSREERNRFIATDLFPIFARYPGLHTRVFDAEYYAAGVSDIIMIEAEDLAQYYRFIDDLRDSTLMRTPYFELINLVPTIEANFESHVAPPPPPAG